MKISHLLAGSALGTATLAGIAIAQVAASNWPQVELADLEQCRPVIAQAHNLEEAYVRKIAVTECNAPARFYSTESCRTARRWLSKTESQDDLVWYFEGNDRCQSTDYPCFGVKIYNTVRTGDEARRWSKYFLDKSGKPFGITRDMDLWTGAREADTCVSGVWAAKYRTANAPPAPPKSEPIQVAEAAPASPAPPVEVKAPLIETPAADDAPQAGAAVAAGAAAATAAAVTTAAVTTAATTTLVKDAPAPAEQALTAAPEQAVAAVTPPPAAVTPPLAAVTPPPATVVATKTQLPAAAVTAKKTNAAAPKGDPMQQVAALVAEGKASEAIALGDKFAASQPAGEGQLTACKTRVLARQDLDRALVACYSTGKSGDPAVLETRGQLHLLAGRHQDAWNDFNAAFAANNANSTLYLRGLASAGMGKTADALKDLAKAEAGQEGVMANYEANGYSLANVMSGKPLVDTSAMGAVVVAAAAPAAPAAAEPAAAAPVVAAAVPAAAKAVAAPAAADVPAPTAVPAAPAVPVPDAVSPPAAEPPAAVPAEPAAPVPTAPEVAIPVSAPAAAPVSAEPAEPAAFAASTGSAVAVPGISLPAVTDCLVPVAPGNGGRGAFKNKCNYPVRFTYCNIKPADGVDQLTCGSDTKFRAETIGGNGSAPALLGQSVAYFACRSPTLPEVIYTSNNGLEGYCR